MILLLQAPAVEIRVTSSLGLSRPRPGVFLVHQQDRRWILWREGDPNNVLVYDKAKGITDVIMSGFPGNRLWARVVNVPSLRDVTLDWATYLIGGHKTELESRGWFVGTQTAILKKEGKRQRVEIQVWAGDNPLGFSRVEVRTLEPIKKILFSAAIQACQVDVPSWGYPPIKPARVLGYREFSSHRSKVIQKRTRKSAS